MSETYVSGEMRVAPAIPVAKLDPAHVTDPGSLPRPDLAEMLVWLFRTPAGDADLLAFDYTVDGHPVEDFAADLQRLVDAYPGHEFGGHAHLEQRGFGQPWQRRLVVVDGTVHVVEPITIWPADSTPRARVAAVRAALGEIYRATPDA